MYVCACACARLVEWPDARGAHRPARPGLSFPALSAAARPAAACRCSALQEQKGELRKRLSYTTHKLEKLETEFDSTRHYLEIELRRAQEELEKVTEKLRRSGGGAWAGRDARGGAQTRGSGAPPPTAAGGRVCRPASPGLGRSNSFSKVARCPESY